MTAFDATPVPLVDDEPRRVSRGFCNGAICAYPQAKQRIETALAEKVADFGRFG